MVVSLLLVIPSSTHLESQLDGFLAIGWLRHERQSNQILAEIDAT